MIFLFYRQVEKCTMVQTQNELVEAARAHVAAFYESHFSEKYVFHNVEHVTEVVAATGEIAAGYQLTDRELEILLIAAWFHDVGYVEGPEGHEERSAKYARIFLENHEFPESDIELVQHCIRATKVLAEPQTLLEKILCDADLSHLGSKTYWEHCTRLRQEFLLTKHIIMSEQEWVDFELDFITNHHYFTDVAQDLLNSRKQKNIRQLLKHKLRLNPDSLELIEQTSKKEKKKKKKKPADHKNGKLNEIDLGRGVETMYRNIYRTHINLSSIADNKANIMLSVNAIIISIVVTSLIPKLTTSPELSIPTGILLAVCLSALVFAILATQPKVTKGKFTRQDIADRKANLLFFGNFYNMDMDDFHWGMMEMIKDSDFLYSSMTRDLYFLGVVLAKKYQYLRICYAIFMFGLIGSVLAFALAFLL